MLILTEGPLGFIIKYKEIANRLNTKRKSKFKYIFYRNISFYMIQNGGMFAYIKLMFIVFYD